MTRHILLVCTILIMATGCRTPKSAVMKLYTIDLPEEIETAPSDTGNVTEALCLINDVNVYPAFASRRIALRDKSHQVQYFDTHQWVVEPARLFLNIMVDFLSRRHLFQQVADRYWQSNPDYIISTNIFSLEVDNTESDFVAHLEVQFELIDNKNNQMVVSHRVNRKTTLKQKDLNQVASAISSMFYEELLNFTHQMRDRLSNAN